MSEAIKDVDTKEKKRPKENKTEIRKRTLMCNVSKSTVAGKVWYPHIENATRL